MTQIRLSLFSPPPSPPPPPPQTCPGLEQYSIKKYAEALEAFPKALAENSGVKVREHIHVCTYIYIPGPIWGPGLLTCYGTWALNIYGTWALISNMSRIIWDLGF